MRGVANVDLTPEVVLALGRAAARVLGGDALRGGARHPPVGAAAGGGPGRRARPPRAWTSRRSGWRRPRRWPGSPPPRDGRRGDLRLAQLLRRQRREALHRGRQEALRRGRGGAREPSCSRCSAAWSRGRRERARPSARSSTARPTSIGGPTRWPGRSRAAGWTGLTVVVDCANGAASAVAPRVLRALGATVEVLHDQPDGTNINAGCGSTHPEDLRRAVVDARRRRRARLRRRRRSGPGHRRHRPADRRRPDHRRSAPSIATTTAASPRTPSSSP